MANKTKKRLVTGIACAVPAVIAVPSLLALTQCAGSSGTEHVKLSGDTKKEESKPILNETFTYEFLLENVDDPLSVQVSLPMLSINGKEIGDGQKLQIYTANVTANSVVTITFNRDEIMKAAEESASDYVPYEIKFDVNLRNDQFNETLSGFTLDMVFPEFDVKQSLSNVKLESASDPSKAVFYTDYVAHISTTDRYHHIEYNSSAAGEHKNFDVQVAGKSIIGTKVEQQGVEVDAVTWTPSEKIGDLVVGGDLTINGAAIKDTVTIIVNGQSRNYDLDVSGTKEGTTQHFTFDYIEGVESGQVQHGKDVSATLNWTTAGKKVVNQKIVTYNEETQEYDDITHKCTFDSNYLYIPGDEIIGPVKISCEFATATATVTLGDGYREGFKWWTTQTSFTVPVNTKLECEFTIPKGNYISYHDEVYMDGKSAAHHLNLEPVYDPLQPGVIDHFKGTVTIDKVTGNVTMRNFDYTAIVHNINLTPDAGKAEWIQPQGGAPWGQDLGLRFQELSPTRGTFIKAGYAIDKENTTAYITTSKATTKLNWTPSYETETEPTYNKDELLNGINISGTQLQQTEIGTIEVKAVTKLCVRTAKAAFVQTSPRCTITSITSDPSVEKDCVVQLALDKGFEVKSVQVHRKALTDDPSVEEPATYTEALSQQRGEFSYNSETQQIIVPKEHVLGNLYFTIDVNHIERTVSAEQSNCTWYHDDDDITPIEGTDKAYADADYTCLFKPNDHYQFEETYKPEVKMNDWTGQPKEFTDFTFEKDTRSGHEGYYLFKIVSTPKSAEKITGDIAISIQATPIKRTVVATYNRTWPAGVEGEEIGKKIVSYTPDYVTEPSIEERCEVKFTAKDGYKLEQNVKPTVKIGGLSSTDFSWDVSSDGKTATLIIQPKFVTGNIEITHDATLIDYDIDWTNGKKLHRLDSKLKTNCETDLTLVFESETYYEIDETTKNFTIGDKELPTGTETYPIWFAIRETDPTIADLHINHHWLTSQFKGSLGSKATVRTVDLSGVDQVNKTDVVSQTDNPSIEKDYEIHFRAKSNYEIKSYSEMSTAGTLPKIKIGTQGEYYPTSEEFKKDETSSDWILKIAKDKIIGNISITFNATPIVRGAHFDKWEKSALTYSGTLDNEPSIEQGAIMTLTAADGYTFTGAGIPHVRIADPESGDVDCDWTLTAANKGTLKVDKQYIKGEIYVKFDAVSIKAKLNATAAHCDADSQISEKDIDWETGFTWTVTALDNYEFAETAKPQVKFGTETEWGDIPTAEEGWHWSWISSKKCQLVVDAGSTAHRGESITLSIAATHHAYDVTTSKITCASAPTAHPWSTVAYYDVDQEFYIQAADGYVVDTDNAPTIELGSYGSGDTLVKDTDFTWEVSSTTAAKLTILGGHRTTNNLFITYKPTALTRTVTFNNTDGHYKATINQQGSLDQNLKVTLTPTTGYQFVTTSTNPTHVSVKVGGSTTSELPEGEGLTITTRTTKKIVFEVDADKLTGDVWVDVFADLIDYSVDVSGVTGATTDAEGKTFHYGTSETVTFTAKPGYTLSDTKPKVFYGAEGQAQEITNYCDWINHVLTIPGTQIKGNITITYAATPVTQTVDTSGCTNCTGSYEPTTGPTVESGCVIQLSANNGYKFIGNKTDDQLYVSIGDHVLTDDEIAEYVIFDTLHNIITITIPGTSSGGAAVLTGAVVAKATATIATTTIIFNNGIQGNCTAPDPLPSPTILTGLDLIVTPDNGYHFTGTAAQDGVTVKDGGGNDVTFTETLNGDGTITIHVDSQYTKGGTLVITAVALI